MEERLQSLERGTCKCADLKPWAKGKGTKRDLLEILDDEEDEGASSSHAEDPPLLDDSYQTPPITDPVVVDERVNDEPLQVPSPQAYCKRVATPHPGAQVWCYISQCCRRILTLCSRNWSRSTARMRSIVLTAGQLRSAIIQLEVNEEFLLIVLTIAMKPLPCVVY